MRAGVAGKIVLSALALGALALTFHASIGRATHLDPRQPTTVVIGPSPGIAPMARIDGARRGRAHDPLPEHPAVLWRLPAHGSFDLASLAVDSRGSIVTASTNRKLTQIGSDGKVEWRAPTGEGPSIGGVVILNDETRAIVTSAAELLGFSPNGALRFHTSLDLAERTARVSLLPLDDGGLAIAAAREVVRIDGDGHLRDRIRVPERIAGPLLQTRAGIVATAQSGAVYAIDAGFAKRLGTPLGGSQALSSLGGDPGEAGASTSDGRTIVAVIDAQRLVAFDLRTGAAQTRFSVTDQSLHGPIVFGKSDAMVLITFAGVLLDLRSTGIHRTALDTRADTLLTDAGKVDLASLDDSPPPITDLEGRVAFARVGGRVGVVSPDGAVGIVSAPVCSSPAALAPAGSRKLVVACRDGAILMIGEETP
jgi:PQQ-like domain